MPNHASTAHMFNLNTDGSKLTYLTSGTKPGKIKFIDKDAVLATDGDKVVKSAAQIAAAGKGGNITGIVFPIGGTNMAIEKDIVHGWGTDKWDPNTQNVIGDPGERNYQLTSGDFFYSNGVEKHGGAQKLVLGVLDAAYVAYNSGVSQGKGLSSMTVTRGDLTLNSSTVTGISGVVNTYSRNYSVNFQYKQSGMIENPATSTTAYPEVFNDLTDEDGDGPF
jgi:hypothetical protein